MAKHRTIKEAQAEIRALRRASKQQGSLWKEKAKQGAVGLGGDAAAGLSSGIIGMYAARVELTQGPERASVIETRCDIGVTVLGALAGAFLPEPFADIVGAMRHASEGALSRRFGKSMVYQQAGVATAPAAEQDEAGAFGEANQRNGVADESTATPDIMNGQGVWETIGAGLGFGGR